VIDQIYSCIGLRCEANDNCASQECTRFISWLNVNLKRLGVLIWETRLHAVALVSAKRKLLPSPATNRTPRPERCAARSCASLPDGRRAQQTSRLPRRWRARRHRGRRCPFAGTRGNGRDAPIAVIRSSLANRQRADRACRTEHNRSLKSRTNGKVLANRHSAVVISPTPGRL